MATDNDNLPARLRAAMTSHASQVSSPPDRWDEIEAGAVESQRRRRRERFGYSILALAAAAVVVAVSASVLQPSSTRRVITEVPATGPQSPTGTATPGLTSTTSAGRAPSVTTAITTAPTAGFAYQLLWPFASPAGARAWQDSYLSGGHEPWHLDADTTALSFTTSYLGFSQIDRVVRHTIGATEAHVAVGYAAPSPTTPAPVAAVIHLIRLGTGADAPWEVVGTDDTQGISVTTPGYGARVTSPAVVGGRISGVDENIHIRVLEVAPTPSPVGDRCCLPAGGTNTSWSTTVSFTVSTGAGLLIVAFTGGHVASVERFTVTGVTT